MGLVAYGNTCLSKYFFFLLHLGVKWSIDMFLWTVNDMDMGALQGIVLVWSDP